MAEEKRRGLYARKEEKEPEDRKPAKEKESPEKGGEKKAEPAGRKRS